MTVLSNAISAKTYRNEWLLLLAQVIGGSLFIALCAQIRIPLPFTPVPITLQSLAVMIVGGMLGSRAGALSVLLYLTESMFGLPVLSGGRIDMLALMSPVGGYLIGFVFLAYVVGWFSERKHLFGKSFLLAGIVLGCSLELILGAGWLAQFVGLSNAFMMGVAPFIPGEILKAIAVYTLLSRDS